MEGLCKKYRDNLYRNVRRVDKWRRSVVPCTPLAVVKCLEHCGQHTGAKDSGMAGKVVAVVNRSEVVGRPLAAMLANDGATVYSIDIDSIYVMERGRMTRTDVTPDDAIKAADVVVLGVPSPQYKLPVATLKKGAVVVNVSGFKNLGDAQEGDDADYTYIPLVGRVTVACLERNLLTLYKQYHVGKISLRYRLAEEVSKLGGPGDAATKLAEGPRRPRRRPAATSPTKGARGVPVDTSSPAIVNSGFGGARLGVAPPLLYGLLPVLGVRVVVAVQPSGAKSGFPPKSSRRPPILIRRTRAPSRCPSDGCGPRCGCEREGCEENSVLRGEDRFKQTQGGPR